MNIRQKARYMVLGCCVMAGGLLFDAPFPRIGSVNEAEAVIGRPMTPGSVAGVARRTTRRTIRRSTIYRASLPRGCSTVVVQGTTLHQCGGTYYQPYKGQYMVVYVD